jgi:hypothetical protein
MTPFQKKIQELGKANGWSYARIQKNHPQLIGNNFHSYQRAAS